MKIVIIQVVILSFFISPQKAYSEDVQTAFLRASIAPFDRTQVQSFLNIVQDQNEELRKTSQGMHLIEQAEKLRRVFTLKEKLDKCLGSDAANSDAAKRILKAGLSDGVKIDCNLTRSPFKDLEAFAKELDDVIDKNKNPVSVSQLAKDIFIDTSLSAARVEARFNYLIVPEDSSSNLPEILCHQPQCPSQLKKQLQDAANQEISDLKASGVLPRSAKQISDTLGGQADKMYMTLYSPSASYQLSNQGAEGAAKYDQLIAKAGSLENLIRNTSLGEALSRRELPKDYVGPNTEKDLKMKENETLSSVPFEFTSVQSSLNSDPVAQLLGRDPTWSEVLGTHSTPKVIREDNATFVSLEPLERPDFNKTRMNTRARLAYINAENIVKSRDEQLSNLRNKLSEIAEGLFSPNLSEKDAYEKFKNLLIANPKAAAQILMNQPQAFNIFCKALKDISKDEKTRKVVGFTLAGFTLATLPFTFVSGATGTAAAAMLTGVAAADVAAGVNEGLRLQELSELQKTACLAESGDSKSCTEYITTMNKAITTYGAAGLSSVGLVPFIKNMARLSGGSELRLAQNVEKLSSVTNALKTENGKIFLSELGEDSGRFMAEMTQSSPQEVSSLMKEIDGLKPQEISALAKRVRSEMKSPSSCAI